MLLRLSWRGSSQSVFGGKGFSICFNSEDSHGRDYIFVEQNENSTSLNINDLTKF